ncbi:hypothetical protein SAY87_002631 [Trapa incisa]|uniref:GRAM domain-containing protein n=1 Tax=Trapa incisa TaxID=236973 RepID=A0AAN7JX11_9MYRT|nr:hypothetical protein SAY87_002631 [Trapa incisa]
MSNPQAGQAINGIPAITGALSLIDSKPSQCRSRRENQPQGIEKVSIFRRMNKLGMKADLFAHIIRDHVKLSPKISETVKDKLSFGARILRTGGTEKVFRKRLIKASQCYLSTTAGPIAGILFISTRNIAFCSKRSLKVSCPIGETAKVHYKILIPLSKIDMADQSKDVEDPSQKYLQIVTVDKFDFWFMRFLNYQKT